MKKNLSQQSQFAAAICLALALISFSTLAGCQQSIALDEKPEIAEWHSFVSSNGKMKVKFPKKPNVKNMKQPTAVGELDMEIVSYEVRRDLAYISNATEMPIDPAKYDVKNGLDSAVAAQTNQGHKILNETEISKFGMPGREILLESKDGKLFIKCRCYIDKSGPTLYQLNIVGSSKAELENEDSNKYLNSFELITKTDEAE